MTATHTKRKRADFFDGMDARKQVRNDLTSDFTVKHIGGVYPDDEHAINGFVVGLFFDVKTHCHCFNSSRVLNIIFPEILE